MKSYHKKIREEREISSRRSMHSRPRTPYLFTTPKEHQNGPFYIASMDYMDTTLSRICPIMGDYLIPIYIQIGSSFSPNIYQKSITNITIVSQWLKLVGFLKLESPTTHESIVLHTSHLVFLLYKLSIDSNLAQLTPTLPNFDLWIPIYSLFHLFPALTNSVFDL